MLVDGSFQALVKTPGDPFEDWFTWEDEGKDWRRPRGGSGGCGGGGGGSSGGGSSGGGSSGGGSSGGGSSGGGSSGGGGGGGGGSGHKRRVRSADDDVAAAGLARRPTGYDQPRDEEPAAGGGGDDPHSARGVHAVGGHGLHGLSVSYSGFTRHRAVSMVPEPSACIRGGNPRDYPATTYMHKCVQPCNHMQLTSTRCPCPRPR